MEYLMRHFAKRKKARRLGILVCACAALLIAPLKTDAKPRQANTPSGNEVAEQAYREVAAKDYTSAVSDFRTALLADPSNLRWRNDLAYACLSAGALGDAAAEFERSYSADPDDLGVALQLGYVFQQLHRDGDAKKYFEIVARSSDDALAGQARKALADLHESYLRDRKQKGYDLIAQKRTSEAITTLESAHDDDPSDANVTLQLGYLYAATGGTDKAVEMFTAESSNSDPAIAAKAQTALDEIRRGTKPWFASFYAAPFYQSRFANEINPANAKFGLNFSRYFQPYVGLRFSRDIRSQAGTLPEIYSDNSAVFSVGIQSVLASTGAVLYAEAGTALNLVGGRPQAASDYRAGMYWSRTWGGALIPPPSESHSTVWTGSVYADGGFYSRYDRNAIGSTQLREGIRLPTGRKLPMQLLAAVNLVKDSNGNFYNNIVEAGPVLRVAPLPSVPGLSLEAQYLRGFYTIHDPANPYGPRYGDFRVFLIWSRNF